MSDSFENIVCRLRSYKISVDDVAVELARINPDMVMRFTDHQLLRAVGKDNYYVVQGYEVDGITDASDLFDLERAIRNALDDELLNVSFIEDLPETCCRPTESELSYCLDAKLFKTGDLRSKITTGLLTVWLTRR